MALTNSQYDEIMREYDARQLENRRRTESRRQTAYQTCAALQKIDGDVASLSVKCAKNLLAGEGHSIDTLKGELAAMRKERRRLLAANGFPEDYLEPVYTCPDCRDTGFVNGRKCHCFRQAVVNMVYAQSNIQAALRRENFDTFSFDYYSKDDIDPATNRSSYDTAKSAVAECREFIEHFDKKPGNLLLFGSTGVGKTFLSNCVAREILNKGQCVIYFTAFQLFEILGKGIFEKDADAIAAHQNIFDCDLLVIDDLGTEMSNAFTASQLFLCVNERILSGKSTIISTNLSLGQLNERYSERTFSRIMDNYTLIKLFTSDIRLQKRQRQTT